VAFYHEEKMYTLTYQVEWKDVLKHVLPKDIKDWKPGDKAIWEPTEEATFILAINNIATDYNCDVAALELSVQQNGIFPIFYCGCGSIDCGGAYVEVFQNNVEVVWRKFWHGQCGGEPLPEDDLLLGAQNTFSRRHGTPCPYSREY